MAGKNVLIALGSPSDTKIVTDFEKSDGTNYFLSVASAHRTPELVEEHASRGWDAVIAGAGMCNALKDAYIRHCDVDTLLVALPLSDSRTDGLSSMISSSEMPPGYPVAMSRLDDLPAAVRFVNAMLEKKHTTVSLHSRGEWESDRAIKHAEEALKMFGVKYQYPTGPDRNGINLVAYDNPAVALEPDALFICTYSIPFFFRLRGGGDSNEFGRFAAYLRGANSRPNCVNVGVSDGANLGLYAAKIVARHDGDVKARIQEHLRLNREKYAGGLKPL